MAELKVKALVKFDVVALQFDKMRRATMIDLLRDDRDREDDEQVLVERQRGGGAGEVRRERRQPEVGAEREADDHLADELVALDQAFVAGERQLTV